MIGARRVLILAPHPDDELVACGIAAMRARDARARVFVLYLTTGVPEPAALWAWHRRHYRARTERRRGEAERAAQLAGLEPAGFRNTPSRQLRSDLGNAAADVDAAIAASGAEAMWVPAFEGAHQDHDAANALAAGFRRHLPVWEFAAYNFAGGQVRVNRFPALLGGEMVIEASEKEAEQKRRALACYRSERGNLRHVGVLRETARELPAHDYAAPPHPGRLFRERFHWVPFRHPRVDFAASAEIFRDIAAFASTRSPVLGQPPGDQPRQADREFAGALDEAERQPGFGRQPGDRGKCD